MVNWRTLFKSRKLNLPQLPEGEYWYAAFVEVVRRDDAVSPFFEGVEDMGGAFLNVCLPAVSITDAETRLFHEITQNNARAGLIEDLRQIKNVTDLPMDQDGHVEDAIAAAFRDPNLSAEIVWGALYLYPQDEETS